MFENFKYSDPLKSLRVAQVMLSRGFGGAERLFVDLCRALPERGVDVLAVCHRDFVARAALETLPGVRIAPVSVRGAWDPWARRRLGAALAHFGPAVIHSHLARGAHLCGAPARSLRIPLVANLHNYVKLKYYRNVDLFLPGSADQGRYLREHGIPAERIEVVPHFSLLPPREPGPPREGGAPAFVALGRFVHKKGFDVLLQALRSVRDRGLSATLLLGGAGPEEARLRGEARRLELGEAVRFTGWIDDVAAFLARGDVFVLPSRDEPFGIVALEAMACGVPIVSTRTQGPREILDDTIAWWAEIGEVESLARAMAAAAAPTARREKAGRALARYRGHYAADVVLPRFLTLYQRLAGYPDRPAH
jgi:glycosyltransferase involved in cell wall biosynthesis